MLWMKMILPEVSKLLWLFRWSWGPWLKKLTLGLYHKYYWIIKISHHFGYQSDTDKHLIPCPGIPLSLRLFWNLHVDFCDILESTCPNWFLPWSLPLPTFSCISSFTLSARNLTLCGCNSHAPLTFGFHWCWSPNLHFLSWKILTFLTQVISTVLEIWICLFRMCILITS